MGAYNQPNPDQQKANHQILRLRFKLCRFLYIYSHDISSFKNIVDGLRVKIGDNNLLFNEINDELRLGSTLV